MKSLGRRPECLVDVRLLIRGKNAASYDFAELRPEGILVVFVERKPAIKHQKACLVLRKLVLPYCPAVPNTRKKRIPSDAVGNHWQERRSRRSLPRLTALNCISKIVFPLAECSKHGAHTKP